MGNMAARASSLKPLALGISITGCERRRFFVRNLKRTSSFGDFSIRNRMATSEQGKKRDDKVIDSHLHVWASPEEAAGKYPYFPGQEPTLPGHVDFLLERMEEAGVDGALIVQPINHKFDHSYVTSVLKEYPSKFVGCCLANPAEDGSGIKEFESLILKVLSLITLPCIINLVTGSSLDFSSF